MASSTSVNTQPSNSRIGTRATSGHAITMMLSSEKPLASTPTTAENSNANDSSTNVHLANPMASSSANTQLRLQRASEKLPAPEKLLAPSPTVRFSDTNSSSTDDHLNVPASSSANTQPNNLRIRTSILSGRPPKILLTPERLRTSPSIVENSNADDYSTNDHLNAMASSSASIQPNNLRVRTTLLFTPDKPLAPPPTVLQSLKAILLASWLNILLLCVPISWALRFDLTPLDKDRDTLVFVFSFFSIIPLVKLLSFATEELSMRVGKALAGFIDVTLGNTVELIIAIIALVKCELGIVHSSLVGSILSNLLLILGTCFFLGGLKYSEQGFSAIAAQLSSSLLTISVIAVLLPAAFHFSIGSVLSNAKEVHDILSVSRGVSLILLTIYASYLFFHFCSHTHLYTHEGDEGGDIANSIVYSPIGSYHFLSHHRKNKDIESLDITSGSKENNDSTPESELETPQMKVWTTICLLIVVTVLIAVTSEWFVDSISGLTSSSRISKEFIAVILIPILKFIGNAADNLIVVKHSIKDKLTLSLGIAVGSSIQIALFVIPFVVTIAWILHKPLSLLFDPYDSITLFLSVLVVNYVVQDGKSNWLKGFILLGLYLILAVTFWYYPGSADEQC